MLDHLQQARNHLPQADGEEEVELNLLLLFYPPAKAENSDLLNNAIQL